MVRFYEQILSGTPPTVATREIQVALLRRYREEYGSTQKAAYLAGPFVLDIATNIPQRNRSDGAR